MSPKGIIVLFLVLLSLAVVAAINGYERKSRGADPQRVNYGPNVLDAGIASEISHALDSKNGFKDFKFGAMS